MRAEQLRKLAGRFLDENIPASASDVEQMFKLLRERAGSLQAVLEIGHHAAHPQNRDRGLVTDAAVGFLNSVRMYMYLRTSAIDFARVPSFFPSAVKHTLLMADKKHLTSFIRLKKSIAATAAQTGLRKFTHNAADDTWSLASELTAEERLAITYGATTLVSKPAFDERQLVDEFWEALCRAHAVKPANRVAYNKRASIVALVAVTALHGTTIKPAGVPQPIGELRASRDHGALIVNLSSPFPDAKIPGLRIETAMYRTTLLASEWCDPTLLEVDTSNWVWPIEIAANPLRIIRL